MMTDPIADMLTRIRNASRVGHSETRCPASKLKASVVPAEPSRRPEGVNVGYGSSLLPIGQECGPVAPLQ